ncbi:MAG: hypothetical protein E5V66_18165 [Mesorhizobium sp.]|nr:MAG: hypothetical protein E5W25_02095 [Mesorhizobium sp.]TIW10450.1 MAG: hypothetical protein E5V66_18165 [Mesorhizobium sp.]TIX73546.1 MAG: hypothetical protein E5V30_01165 [Mesorhizobium sp.]
MPSARIVVNKLGNAAPRMELLIICDPYTTSNAEPLALAAQEVGASFSIIEISAGAHHGQQLAPPVAAAMKASDLIIAPTRRNIAHTQARRDAQQAGAKVICLPEADNENFFLAAGWDADFDTLRSKIDGLAAAFTRASTARVTSKLGTDITMSIKGRNGRSLNGFANTNDISCGYCLEASLAPVEGTANGRIVVNASIPGIGLIGAEPVSIEVKNGFAVSIEGGPEAVKFRNLLASFNDPNVYNLGELGIGMNPMCSLDGTMCSDESVWGGVQLALGTSAYIGGTCKAAAHYDTIVTDATLELDGRIVFEGTDLRLH